MAALPAAGQEKPDVGKVFAELRQYDDGKEMRPLRTIEMLVARSTAEPKARGEMADRLAAVLADEKASLAARRFACGQLALVASDAHVPLLAKLLGDPQLTEAARRALAAIPGAAAGAALREAAAKLKGPQLVGLINSLGDRRDAEAVGALDGLLGGLDLALANAAATALGKIGTAEAAERLDRANTRADVRALQDARLRCAEHLAAAGNRAAAAGLYRQLAESSGAVEWRVAGLMGLAKAAPDDCLPLVVEALAADNTELRGAALRAARELPGAKATAGLAAAIEKIRPEAQALLIGVLADRGDRSAAAAVTRRLDDKQDAVRIAAVRAMATLGDASVVSKLAGIAVGESGAAQQAARASLERMSGEGVDRELLSLAGRGEPAVRAAAVAALTGRNSDGAEAALTKLLADADEAVRVAAIDGLAVLGTATCYPKLVARIVSGPDATARAAEKAALAVGGRLGDPAQRARPILAALKTAPARAKEPLFSLLSACGGDEALAAVRAGVGDADESVADAAVRALANWPDTAAAGDLLKLAQAGRTTVHRTLALRGYLRLARTVAGAAERLKMLQAVRQIAKTPPEKRLLLGALAGVADAAALDLAVALTDDKEVHKEAALAAIGIGKSLLDTDRPAVRAGMAKLQAKLTDAGLLEQAKALAAEALKPPRRRGGAGGSDVGLAPDKARSDAARKLLAADGPQGFRLVCYLDCGPDDADGANGAPTLRSLGGSKHSWPGADRVNVRHGTVVFDGREVAFEITGLDAKKAYQLGFSWWDYDHDTRAQSVWLSAGKPARRVALLGATKLPSNVAGKKADVKTVAVPREMSAFGTVRVHFMEEGGPNVVVSEIWLWESDAESAPARPMPPQPAATNGPAGKKGQAEGPRVTEPKAVRPGKKGAKRVLIVTGNDYPGHKWRLTTPVLAAGLDADPRLAIDTVETADFLASPKLADYDAIVLHWMNWQTPDPGEKAREGLAGFVRAGGGLVLVHFACGAFQGWPEFAKVAGRAWNPKLRGHDPRGEFRVEIADADHPVTKGLEPFETADELYTCLDGNTPIHVLATAKSKVDKKDYPMAFVLTCGKGRVFHSVLGHDVKAFGPAVLELYRRGTAWAAGLEPGAAATNEKGTQR